VKTVFLNPAFLLQSLLREDKLIYALQVLAPVVLLPLRRRRALLLIAPAVLPTLFAYTEANRTLAPFMISFQYTSHWTSCVFLASAVSLSQVAEPACEHDRLGKIRFVAAVSALCFATLATSYQFGAVFQHHTAKAGFDLFSFGTTPDDLARRADRKALVVQIPKDAKVAASERELPHMANRRWAYTLRSGIFDAEYVLVSHGLPWSRGDDLVPVEQVLRDGSFGLIETRGNFSLLKRGFSTEKNVELLRKLGRQ
jgi:uncharacterized membrane protein